MEPIIPEIARAMRVVLNEVANEAGRASGLIKRQRKLSGASFVQSLVFAYLAKPAATSAELGQAAATLGVTITRQGLDKRFSEAAARCMERVLAAAVKAVVQAQPVASDLLQRFSAVHVVDSSTIVLPDSLAHLWQGCGGNSANNTQSAVKICVDLDLRSGTLDGPLLQSGRDHDRQALAYHRPLARGALLIADLAYFKLEAFAQMQSNGTYYLSRLKGGTHLFMADGTPLDLLHYLETSTATLIDMEVQLGQTLRLPSRLLAVRVPPEVAQQRRERLEDEERHKGQVTSQARFDLTHWTVFVTNVPNELLSVDEALVLGRSRWQVEILFKLWKSDGLIDESRSDNPWHILTEFYAKLIAMIIQHWLFLTELWDHPDRSLHQASQVIQKHALHLASYFHDFEALLRAIQVVRVCLATCRMSKCRSKRHTFELWLQFNL